MDPTNLTDAAREFFRRCGAEGGRKGGPARAAKLSKRRRRQIARMGARAREEKRLRAKYGGGNGGA